jgi:hypothetical protein
MLNISLMDEIKNKLNVPNDSEFLTLCSSFTQYTGKKIRIKFLEKPVQANKFIEVVYDEYIAHFINTEEMARSLSGFMYADLKEKAKTNL